MNGLGCFITLVPFLVMLWGFFSVRTTYPLLAWTCLFIALCIAGLVGGHITQTPYRNRYKSSLSPDLEVTSEINDKKMVYETALMRCVNKQDWKAMDRIQANYDAFKATIEHNPKYEPNEGYWRYKKN